MRGLKGLRRLAAVTLLRHQTPELPTEEPSTPVQIRMMRHIAGGRGLVAAVQFGSASVDCGYLATVRALLEISFLGQLTRNNRSVRGFEQVAGLSIPLARAGYRTTWLPTRKPNAQPLVTVSC